MIAGLYDLYIERGATFTRTFTFYGSDGNMRDLSGYSIRSKIRATYGAAASVTGWDLDSSTGGWVISGGVATMTASAAVTAATAIDSGVWDAELVAPGGTVERVLQGVVVVSPEATK